MNRPNLRLPVLALEVQELALVASGAIPGALLRWQFGLLLGSPAGMAVSNVLGCAVIGLLIGLQPPRPRLYLAAGVGFCGSLTTFSAWILELTKALVHQHWSAGARELSVSLGWGLLALALAYGWVRIRR